MSFPDEVVVSIFSVRLLKPTPFSCSSVTVSIRCLRERPSRYFVKGCGSIAETRKDSRRWPMAALSPHDSAAVPAPLEQYAQAFDALFHTWIQRRRFRAYL